MNIYRPPKGDYKKGCKLITEGFEKAVLRDNTEIFIMGDFNIDFSKTTTPSYKELDFTMRLLGLPQFVLDPTRSYFKDGINHCSRLDLIFSNPQNIQNTKVLDINISDHQAVMTTHKKLWVNHTKVKFKGRLYTHYVKEDFQELLQGVNWDRFFAMNDPDLMWDFLRTTIAETIDPICPLKTFIVQEAREPWIANKALQVIRDKD